MDSMDGAMAWMGEKRSLLGRKGLNVLCTLSPQKEVWAGCTEWPPSEEDSMKMDRGQISCKFKRPGTHDLSQLIKVNISCHQSCWWQVALMRCDENGGTSPLWFPSLKPITPVQSWEKRQTNPNRVGSLQNSCLKLLKPTRIVTQWTSLRNLAQRILRVCVTDNVTSGEPLISL